MNIVNIVNDTKLRLKCVLLGDEGVGKTTIASLFLDNKRKQNTTSTIGFAFCSKNIQNNNKTIGIDLWDTAGQERFRSIINMYYRNASVILLVFDISCRDTWETVDYWYNEILLQNDGANKPIFVLVGNKSDLRHEITKKEIIQKSIDIGAYYYIFSSFDPKAPDIIHEIFTTIIDKIYDNNSIEDIHNTNISGHINTGSLIIEDTPSSITNSISRMYSSIDFHSGLFKYCTI